MRSRTIVVIQKEPGRRDSHPHLDARCSACVRRQAMDPRGERRALFELRHRRRAAKAHTRQLSCEQPKKQNAPPARLREGRRRRASPALGDASRANAPSRASARVHAPDEQPLGRRSLHCAGFVAVRDHASESLRKVCGRHFRRARILQRSTVGVNGEFQPPMGRACTTSKYWQTMGMSSLT